MKKIKCVIVDDEPTAREILTIHLNKLNNISLVAGCDNAIEALDVINRQEVDLMFLDINMPEMSGLTLKKIIGDKTKVIFTTAHREYALEGFELNAIDYLLKPITFERLLQAIGKYQEITPIRGSDQLKVDNTILPKTHLFVKSDRKMIRIDIAEILYLESYSDYVKIILKSKTIVTRELISKLEIELPAENFIRIHRSFIVAINKITLYTNEYVEIDGQELVISRGYKEQALQRLRSS